MALMNAAQFAKAATDQAGKRYVLGQPTPYKGGAPSAFDCSGLVIWLINLAGMVLGDRVAAALWNLTSKVSGEIHVGDMVFLSNLISAKWASRVKAYGNRAGHVAIVYGGSKGVRWNGDGTYTVLGEPLIIEARGTAEGVVKTTYIFWRGRRYYGGIRRWSGFKLAAPAATPTPAPDSWTYPGLSKGSKGKLVTTLQAGIRAKHPILSRKAARAAGASKFVVDGQYGAVTRAVVIAIEKQYGRTATGRVGKWMWTHLGLAAKVRTKA